ncbi:dTDP-4-dehydrorhamnose reductase [Candidatus Kaiserbacteria bacterium RIFCSPHIGHO2_01_FULL_48_10]|uniref:dTDP-4-dehydrorhamnose reductase n=1 Tax=Candidatus Kaiserbacteria bacterium RIFCSPHIGHO2_01_FULL_48_10 TaxID=1798476 RepID=A0A1F6C706_9BACT|nr:MAG: dTDP-4-dehydrorhamnose reductase [Candidatus Kaiserbacteria bacterium RIFCSPHIGHO2_01_FULL_48_10]HLC99957.1 dTDP-4-dehydrorhamnose reductase [Patescibacteria group bacterium]
MRVLVLGAKGMLGQELVKIFSDNVVTAWDKDDLDITNREEVFQKIREQAPDVILNAAAYNAVDKAEEEEGVAFAVNAEAVNFLAQAASEIGSLLVHYSTDYVFDGAREAGYQESAEPSPQSAYARSKAQGEKYLQEIGGRFYLIRLSRLFGKPGAGEGSKKSFVDSILKLATPTQGSGEAKKELEVVDEELSSPTYAPDLGKLTKGLIDRKLPYGIYHGANSGACTWYEFANEALKTKNISCTLKPVKADRFPRKALRPKYSVLLNTKLPPTRDWKEALREYLTS